MPKGDMSNLLGKQHTLTPEDRRRGGIASQAKKKQQKTMRELAALMLDQKTQPQAAKALEKLFPDLDAASMTYGAQAVAAQVNKAIKGDLSSTQWLSEMQLDQRASERTVDTWHMDPMDLTTDALKAYRAIHDVFDRRDTETRDIVLRGGRGGAKSSLAAEVAHEAMLQDGQANVVFGRRFKSDLRDSVYAQFRRACAGDPADAWEFRTSPMRATYKPSGCSAYFVGFDSPEQLKSFVPDVGYVKMLVFEEADELLGNEQIDNATDTFLRSSGTGDVAQIRVKVFNPPPSKSNFMNAWCEEVAHDKSVRIFDFSYLNVPQEWLGAQFFERAEWFRVHKPQYYANNYGGEVTGTGGELFGNVESRTISDEEWKKLNEGGDVYDGLDFGYEHPMVWSRVHYDRDTDTLTILWEHVAQHANLGQFLAGCADWKRDEVICDSAEPDRIADMRADGWQAIGAIKRWGGGKGRAYAWEWLRSRSKIVVDQERTPEIYRELTTLEFERLKDGTYTSRYPDIGEDGVMATIYGLNRVIMRGELV